MWDDLKRFLQKLKEANTWEDDSPASVISEIQSYMYYRELFAAGNSPSARETTINER